MTEPDSLPPAALGPVFRSRREEMGSTIRQIANKTGINESYLRMIERGARAPGFALCEEICEALGLPYRRVGTDLVVNGQLYGFRMNRSRSQASPTVILVEIRELLTEILDVLKNQNVTK